MTYIKSLQMLKDKKLMDYRLGQIKIWNYIGLLFNGGYIFIIQSKQ